MYIFTLVPFCVCEFLLTIQCFRWEGLQSFLSKDRTPLYCDNERSTKGFSSSYKNLHFYWILGAGHFVSQLSHLKIQPQIFSLALIRIVLLSHIHHHQLLLNIDHIVIITLNQGPQRKKEEEY